MYRRLFALLLFFLLITNARGIVAQGRGGNLKVRVVYSDGRPASGQLLVRLMSGASSTPVSEIYTTDAGMVEFSGIPNGAYHVIVTGQGIEEADSGGFEVDNRKMTQSLFITVRRVDDSKPKQAGTDPALVAAADLNVPKTAEREFDKANKAIARQDWKKAVTLLNKAISVYPQYASAYNNLGVAYTRMHDAAHAREALEKAISLNDHFASALVNLARLYLQEESPAQAETLLERADAAEPTNAQGLLLLAQAQLLNRHYDAAIASARKVHALPHEHMALAHYIAARAFEHENRAQEAVAELQTFLQEEPQGPRAAQARDEMARIQHQARPVAPPTVAH